MRTGNASFDWRRNALEVDKQSRNRVLEWAAGQKGDNGNLADGAKELSTHWLEEPSATTDWHRVKCINSATVRRTLNAAGLRCRVLTNGIDIQPRQKRSEPVEIGEYCFVGTGCILLKGARLSSRSVLGAGSVLGKKNAKLELGLYAGNPATLVRPLNPESKYFARRRGYVL